MGQLSLTSAPLAVHELQQLLSLLENKVDVTAYRRHAPRSVAHLVRNIVGNMPAQVAVATFHVHNTAQPWRARAAEDNAGGEPQPHNKVLTRPQLQALQTILTALQECLARGTNDYDRLTFGQEQDADRECQVCMDSKVQVVLQCSHGFCQTCLDDWMEQNPTCPLCRMEVGNEQIQDSWLIETWEQKDLHQNADQLQERAFQILLQAPDVADDFFTNYVFEEENREASPAASTPTSDRHQQNPDIDERDAAEGEESKATSR